MTRVAIFLLFFQRQCSSWPPKRWLASASASASASALRLARDREELKICRVSYRIVSCRIVSFVLDSVAFFVGPFASRSDSSSALQGQTREPFVYLLWFFTFHFLLAVISFTFHIVPLLLSVSGISRTQSSTARRVQSPDSSINRAI